jgi:hypothetical protein
LNLDLTREYAAKVYFVATPSEFDGLDEKVLNAVTEALGCTNDPEHECTHFRVAFSGPRGGRRRWAVRCALADLWTALRFGEVA